MKFLFNIPLVLSFAQLISAQVTSCYTGTDFSLTLEKECSYQQVRRRMVQKIKADASCTNSPPQELTAFVGALGYGSEIELEAEIIALCARAKANADLETISFSEITGEGETFDIDFFNGGTYLNLEVQTELADGTTINVLKDDAAFIQETMENVASDGVISFPSDYEKFDSCDLRAVNCCWIGDRQANDNNGNCKEPYDINCVDATPKANSAVCLNGDVDQETAELYPRIHCHGFAWAADDPMDASTYFRGNNLFYVSMYDHLYSRGYVKNIPGQPMCGCIEDMPSVKRADCTEVRPFASFGFKYLADSMSMDITLDAVEVNYKACAGANDVKNDLEAYYMRLVEEGKATADELVSVQEKLDGDCEVPELVKDGPAGTKPPKENGLGTKPPKEEGAVSKPGNMNNGKNLRRARTI